MGSAPGRGSMFRVFFPLHPTTVQDGEPWPDADRSSLDGAGTVQLVDDMGSVRNVARSMLERLGFGVITARDRAEAVDIFHRRAKDIRMVLTDLFMPGLNGWETLAAVRGIHSAIPVILASGYGEATALAEHPGGQSRTFLSKPYRMDDLKATPARTLADGRPQKGQGGRS